MSNALPSAAEKPRTVQRMFDRLAPRYDRVNRAMTFGMDQRWRRSLLARLQLRPADTVVDLACGTGDFAEAAHRLGCQSVVAVDFSGGMLRAASGRLPQDIALLQADALRLPLASGSVDAVVSGFALRNFAALPPVFAELARVMPSGGRLGLLEVDRPRNPLIRLGHGLYFRRIVPLIGALLSGDRPAYVYLPASEAYLPTEREMVQMLQDAGFHQISKHRPMFGAIQALTAVRK